MNIRNVLPADVMIAFSGAVTSVSAEPDVTDYKEST